MTDSVQNGKPTVPLAASLFQEMCYQNKDQLSAGIIVGGWDKENGGSVWNIPLGGSLHRQPFAIGGSGSTYIYGYCDATYRDGMNQEECIEFVKNCKCPCIVYHYPTTEVLTARCPDSASSFFYSCSNASLFISIGSCNGTRWILWGC